MFFTVALYASLAIFALGLVYKISTWFRYSLGIDAENISTSARIFAALQGIVLTVFSKKVFTLLRVFVLDVLLQVKVLRQDFLKWAMHMCIYYGFILLLLMHGLDAIVTSALFPEYYPTVNPFLFLRDFFGVLVLVGVGIAIYRRFVLKVPRLRTSPMDLYAIIILAVIIFSGFLLEGTKITSYSKFQEMVDEYTMAADEQELTSLESYWVAKFGVVSPKVQGPFDAATLAAGKEAHELNCSQCHSRPQWGFAGYATSIITRPLAITLDQTNARSIFWYIHFLACMIGLAYLPFSKMFHMFTTPLSLLANSVMDKETSAPANITMQSRRCL
jgi:nitrate reductase gamma subunit